MYASEKNTVDVICSCIFPLSLLTFTVAVWLLFDVAWFNARFGEFSREAFLLCTPSQLPEGSWIRTQQCQQLKKGVGRSRILRNRLLYRGFWIILHPWHCLFWSRCFEGYSLCWSRSHSWGAVFPIFLSGTNGVTEPLQVYIQSKCFYTRKMSWHFQGLKGCVSCCKAQLPRRKVDVLLRKAGEEVKAALHPVTL